MYGLALWVSLVVVLVPAVGVGDEPCVLDGKYWHGSVWLRHAGGFFAQAVDGRDTRINVVLDGKADIAAEVESEGVAVRGITSTQNLVFFGTRPIRLDEWLTTLSAPLRLMPARMQVTLAETPDGLSTKRPLEAAVQCSDLSLEEHSFKYELPSEKGPIKQLAPNRDIPLALIPTGRQ